MFSYREKAMTTPVLTRACYVGINSLFYTTNNPVVFELHIHICTKRKRLKAHTRKHWLNLLMSPMTLSQECNSMDR